jgi:hypothetical protein
MENMEKKCEGGCKCGSCGGMQQGMGGCGCHHGGRHHLMKMILKLVIVIIIFWCGFKLGEMTGFIQAQYGRGMMMRGGNFNVVAPGANGLEAPATN